MKLITGKLSKDQMGRLNINPDVIMTGIKTYIINNYFDGLFEFITAYVHSDSHLCKCMQKKLNITFLELISPSDIVYVIALIKNGEGQGWDHDLRKEQNPHGVGRRKCINCSQVVRVK